MANGLFVTGTDTGVGKTRVAQALVSAAVNAGRRAVGMKPVASGAHVSPPGLRNEDAEALIHAANVFVPYADVNPYVFEPAIAPHIAAKEVGVEIQLDTIKAAFDRLAANADCVIVEGAGGWLAPISHSASMADVACALGLPVVLVVGMRLGCLNHALLTHEAIAKTGLPLAGWVANCVDPSMARFEANLATLQDGLRMPPIAVVPNSPTVSLSVIEQLKTLIVKADQIGRT